MTATLLSFPAMPEPLDQMPNRVRYWRKKRGLTVEQLGRRIGVQKAQVSRIELGQRDTGLFMYKRIAAALDVTVADLLTAEDNPINADPEAPAIARSYIRASDEGRRIMRGVAQSVDDYDGGERILPFASGRP